MIGLWVGSRNALHFKNFIHLIKSLSPNLSLNIYNSVLLILYYIHKSLNEKISCYVKFPRPQLLPDVCSLLGNVYYLFLLDDIISREGVLPWLRSHVTLSLLIC